MIEGVHGIEGRLGVGRVDGTRIVGMDYVGEEVCGGVVMYAIDDLLDPCGRAGWGWGALGWGRLRIVRECVGSFVQYIVCS